MPIYELHCQSCGVQKDELMKYDDMKSGVTCECGGSMRNVICPPAIMGSSNKKFVMKPNVGPMAKDTKAYQKKHDEEGSLDCYKPGGTFGGSGNKSFKEVNKRKGEAMRGKTDFSKDK